MDIVYILAVTEIVFMNKPTNIDAYIKSFPQEIQKQLEQMRAIIKKAAPNAVETISYGIPAFKQHRVLVYFAGYKNHIGFYPTSSGIKVFAADMEKYKMSKGAVQFPIDKPLPATLISKIVKYRVADDKAHEEKKQQPGNGFVSQLSAPARRALETEGIKTLKQLSTYSENDILKLHGIGPSSMPKLREILAAEGLAFKQKKLK